MTGAQPGSNSADGPRAGRLSACVGFAAAYVLAGRLGLLLAVPPGYATAIFPPAGLAVAAMFIAGPATLPWTFIGSLLLNFWVGIAAGHELGGRALIVALDIAAASAAQAAAGGWLLRRLIGYPTALDTVRDVARLFLSAPVICLVSATLSLGGMLLLHAVNLADFITNWLAWWMGDTLGVLLFLPLTMVVAGQPRAAWSDRMRPVALPMLLFFALFVAIFIKVSAWENQQSLLEFRLLSQQLFDKTQAQFTAQEAFVGQLGTSFSGPAHLSRRDFTIRAHNLLDRFPEIQAIEWAPRVTAAERDNFIATMRQDQPDFTIRERDDNGALRDAGDRAECYPVAYVAPETNNAAALGFDLASNAKRAAAIRRAIRDGAATASAPVSLVQARDHQTGMLLLRNVPSGPNGPGVVLTVLRMPTLFDALIGSSNAQLGVQATDRETGRTLFDSLPPGTADPARVQVVSIGGRDIVMRSVPTPAYFAAHRAWQSWVVLMIGVLSTGLLGALLMLTTGERQRFARLLSERTRERDRIWQVSEDLLGVSDFAGYFLSVNPAWTRTLGWSEAEIKTIHVNDLRHPADLPIGVEGRRRLADGVGTVRMENRFRHKDGSYRWIYWTLTAEQGLIYVIGRDVTADRDAALEHQRTEEQLRQLQKMDTVGQLTGGIAHDFNNLLTVILGNLEIIERSLGNATERIRRAVKSAMNGATRAATLTQRLLAFAQKQPLRPRAVEVNELVRGMADLIRRTQGETFHYDFALADALPFAFCDANQLETALLNLVLNARDAMTEGGRLRIETGRAMLDAATAQANSVEAGIYVTLAVCDSGTGMSPEIAARVFEPFFTTKATGKGTGLGLSMVYGFVKQSKGHVELDSTPGRGTTVRLYLPSLPAGDQPSHDATDADAPTITGEGGHGETILVVEDDAEVRQYVADTLRDLNYTVVEAAAAEAALEILSCPQPRIDLLLTDVVMPGLNGRELARRAVEHRPGLKVQFMTGYSQDAIMLHGRLDPDVALIEKPFRRDILAARVHAMLASNTESVSTLT